MPPTRRDFLKTTGAGALAAAATLHPGTPAFAQAATPPLKPKRRYAIVGTGVRGLGMWGRPLLSRYAEAVEFVGLCDINSKRVELAKESLKVSCPTFTDFDRMCDTVKPELLTVTTVDAFHAEYIVRALDRGIDVLTEKPMVVNEAQCQQVLDAERRNKRKIIVAFNYRFAPKHVQIKEPESNEPERDGDSYAQGRPARQLEERRKRPRQQRVGQEEEKVAGNVAVVDERIHHEERSAVDGRERPHFEPRTHEVVQARPAQDDWREQKQLVRQQNVDLSSVVLEAMRLVLAVAQVNL